MTLVSVLTYQPQRPGFQEPRKHQVRCCPVLRVPLRPRAPWGGLALQSPSLAEGDPGQGNPNLGAGLAFTPQKRIAPRAEKSQRLAELVLCA